MYNKIIGVAIVVVTLVVLIVGVQAVTPLAAPASIDEVTDKAPSVDVTGQILFTSSEKSQLYLTPLAYDFAQAKMVGNGFDAESLGEYYSLSGDGTYAVFVGTTRTIMKSFTETPDRVGDAFQVYIGPVGANHAMPLAAHSFVLTDAHHTYLRNPVVTSDVKLVAYESLPDTAQGATTTIESNVEITDVPTGNVLLNIPHAVSPHWVSDTVLGYISAQGVVLYDVVAQKSTILIPYAAAPNSKLSISPSHTYLILSTPDARKVFCEATRSVCSSTGFDGRGVSCDQ